MKTTSKTILFFGNERLATGVTSKLPVFQYLVDQGYKVPAIIVSQSNIDKASDIPEIIELARSLNIDVLNPPKLLEAADRILSYKAEAAVLAAYGKLVPSSIINLFPKGIINIHPSLLPKHRGPTPIESVILGGDTETGVSLMQLSKGMDSGQLYDQVQYSLSGEESKQELANSLDKLGQELVEKHLDSILEGRLVPKKQPENGTSYDQLITKGKGVIDWKDPALQIARQIRAYSVWPKTKADIKGIEVTLIEGHVVAGKGPVGSVLYENGSLGIYTSKDILIIDKLLPSGKKIMSGQSFMAGYGNRL